MKIITHPSELKKAIEALRHAGRTIGFVPTMGALHEGHLSLMRRARSENGAFVVSIFVNPLQFGRGEDLSRYPRSVESDKRLTLKAGADILFMPRTGPVLRLKSLLKAAVPKGMDRNLCGPFRPGHFPGVVRIVALLFRLTKPDRAYFGLKDYQQYRIIEAMARKSFPRVQIIGCPTVREKDGLAMSSRNRYLKPAERKWAPELYRSLKFGRNLIRKGETDARIVVQKVKNRLAVFPAIRPQYIQIVGSKSLKKVVELRSSRQARPLVAAAVYLGKTRLIDNVLC